MTAMQTRSQTQRSTQQSQKSVEQNQVSDVVSVNWCFFNPQRPMTFKPVPIKIPERLFSGATVDCQTLFGSELQKRYKITVEEESITFWRPKHDLSLDAAEKDWVKFTNPQYFKDSLKKIYLPKSFSRELKELNLDEEFLHLVVTADGSYSKSGMIIEEEKEADDTLSPLPEFINYDKIVHTKGRPPSIGAKSTEYQSVQNTEGEVIHDGRYPPEPAIATTAPPIYIYHPIFDEFLYLHEDADTQPTAEEVEQTHQLMQFLSQIYGGGTSRNENVRNAHILRYLQASVHTGIKSESNIDKTQPDGILRFKIGGDFIPCFIIELKRELGEGGSDPSTQAGISYRRSWILENVQKTRDKCCCPTLILTGGGPWLSVMGAVLTDKVIVQRLTDLQWGALSATEEDKRVYEMARTFLALKKCILRLQSYYEGLHDPGANIPSLIRHQPHPRYYPYPTSFTYNNRKVKFEYLRALEKDSACVTFQARILEDIPTIKSDIVVKFVARYGEEAHRFLVRKGHAPDLYYCGAIPETERLVGISGPAGKAIPGLSLRADLMHMVVMEYIEHDSRLEIPRASREQLKTILEEFHCEGYVFGDLRNQNILLDLNGQVKLIDFNWCGPYDVGIRDENLPEALQRKINDKWKGITRDRGPYAYYPLGLGKSIIWPRGVKSLVPIRPIHDWVMFEKIL